MGRSHNKNGRIKGPKKEVFDGRFHTMRWAGEQEDAIQTDALQILGIWGLRGQAGDARAQKGL